jgi:hypothetical protein
VVDVEQVVVDPLVEVAGGAVVTADLPKTRDARPHREPRFAPGYAHLVLTEWGGTRPHQAHLALQDVKQLRELVDVEAAEPMTEPGDSGVVVDLELRPVDLAGGRQLPLRLVRVHDHGPELPAAKNPAPAPFPPVAEEQRAVGIELDEQGDECEQRE